MVANAATQLGCLPGSASLARGFDRLLLWIGAKHSGLESEQLTVRVVGVWFIFLTHETSDVFWQVVLAVCALCGSALVRQILADIGIMVLRHGGQMAAVGMVSVEW